jgi:hypothetical protein
MTLKILGHTDATYFITNPSEAPTKLPAIIPPQEATAQRLIPTKAQTHKSHIQTFREKAKWSLTKLGRASSTEEAKQPKFVYI